MSAVNDSVCMALCRCRNSRSIVVSSKLLVLCFGHRHWHTSRGVIINIVCGLASPMNSVGHADSEQQEDSSTQTRLSEDDSRKDERKKATMTVFRDGSISSGHTTTSETCNQILPLSEILACAFPLFLQLWSLVESLLCSSKAEMWGESTLSEIGTQISADRQIQRSNMTENNTDSAYLLHIIDCSTWWPTWIVKRPEQYVSSMC